MKAITPLPIEDTMELFLMESYNFGHLRCSILSPFCYKWSYMMPICAKSTNVQKAQNVID